MSSSSSYFFIVPFVLCASHVHGQTLEEIEIIGRKVNLIGSATSATEGLISHEELRLRPLLRTGEILESVPGLVATQHSGSGKANQFYLRGFNLDHGTDFSTSIDGMPVNLRSHGHGQGYTDLNFIIPEMIEEISFRKGSYFADAGDFSAAGSARLATAQHLDQTTVSLAIGEYGYQRLLLTGSAANPAGTLLYGVERQRYAGPWDVVDEDVQKTNVWLKQRWQQASDQVELMFMAYDNHWNSADQIPARAVASGQISAFGSIDPTVGGESSRYSASANWVRTTSTGTIQASLYGIDYDMELYSNFSYFTAPAGDQFQQVDQRKLYGGSLEWRRDSMMGEWPVTNILGVQLRVDDIAEVGLRSSRNQQVTGNIRVDAVKESSLGSYWQNELHWTGQLRSVAGLRYDAYDFAVDPLAAGHPASLPANRGSSTADLLTGSLSLIYTFNNNLEAYASIGQGFHSNDARGTTIRLDPLSGVPVSPVDPLVDTLGSEIGLRTFLTDRLNASIALWQLDIDSELLFVGDAGNTEDTGVASERRGVELTAYYEFNSMWSLDMEYAWTDAKFRRPLDGSREIPGALESVFSGGLTLVLQDRLSAAFRLRHFADYPLDAGARAAGSTLANLRVSYEISPRLSLTADILNAFDSDDHDVEYFYESQLATELAPVADHHSHIFEPRSARIYINYRF